MNNVQIIPVFWDDSGERCVVIRNGEELAMDRAITWYVHLQCLGYDRKDPGSVALAFMFWVLCHNLSRIGQSERET